MFSNSARTQGQNNSGSVRPHLQGLKDEEEIMHGYWKAQTGLEPDAETRVNPQRLYSLSTRILEALNFANGRFTRCVSWVMCRCSILSMLLSVASMP